MTLSLFLQGVGTVAGISGAVLTVFKKRGCWVAYGTANIVFISLFLVEHIYIPILQYIVFMTINIIGWFKWSKDAKKQKAR